MTAFTPSIILDGAPRDVPAADAAPPGGAARRRRAAAARAPRRRARVRRSASPVAGPDRPAAALGRPPPVRVGLAATRRPAGQAHRQPAATAAGRPYPADRWNDGGPPPSRRRR